MLTEKNPETPINFVCNSASQSRNPASKGLKMNAGVASSVLKALAARQVEIEEFHQLQVVVHHFLESLLER